MEPRNRGVIPVSAAGLLLLLGAPSLIGCGEDNGDSTSGADSRSLEARSAIEDLAQQKIISLREHVGEQEEVNLDVYFVGFPDEVKSQLEQAIRTRLQALKIVDTKPWWIPRKPLFGKADFDLRPAPQGLPSDLTPPDGMIRYDGGSFTRVVDPDSGRIDWQPNREINDSVDDWHDNVDIVNYVEHDGAYTDVEWAIGDMSFIHLPAAALTSLYPVLQGSKVAYTSSQPSQTFQLYSYDQLIDWLEQDDQVQERRGGASLVFLNLPGLSGEPYSFYAEPERDVYPLRATAPIEVQYPKVAASNAAYQDTADLMNGALGGGMTQAKMFAALELMCAGTRDASGALRGAKAGQTLCAHWSLDPITNLVGSKARRFFVSDATRELAQLNEGSLDAAGFARRMADNAFELYRYGVLQPSIKANNPYSEAYELRVVVVDLRYDETDMCVLDKVQTGTDPTTCLTSTVGYPSEKTYELDDVFDQDLAARSLANFSPAHWKVTTLPFPFGATVDGTIDPIAGAQAKAALRTNLSEPSFPNPAGGAPIQLTHPPLYRELSIVNASGGFDKLTSSWELGIDGNVAQAAFIRSRDAGGLGVYEAFWPDAKVVGEVPFHQTGVANVKPLVFIMTPSPSGPRGEKWGTFPVSVTQLAQAGLVWTFGGGGWWASVSGNEQGGAPLRRDFFLLNPQYMLGKHRGNGSSSPWAVMPDGTVQAFDIASDLTAKALEVGTVHWVDEFDSNDPELRGLARSFVREVSTLQGIETLQHGLGYLHNPEDRRRFHYDGQYSSFKRLEELSQDPADHVGHTLHQYVNMYTTHGVSTVWGHNSSEWNGLSPDSGMQATLFRSHAREALAAAEDELRYALDEAAKVAATVQPSTVDELRQAIDAHEKAQAKYDDWEYAATIELSWRMLHGIDQALTAIGQPDRVHDPLEQASFPVPTSNEN